MTISCGSKNKDKTMQAINPSTGKTETVQILDQAHYEQIMVFENNTDTLITFKTDGVVLLNATEEQVRTRIEAMDTVGDMIWEHIILLLIHMFKL